MTNWIKMSLEIGVLLYHRDISLCFVPTKLLELAHLWHGI
jgi:hypothetical protein